MIHAIIQVVAHKLMSHGFYTLALIETNLVIWAIFSPHLAGISEVSMLNPFHADAGKAGVGKDAVSATRMSLDEAQKILGISKDAPLEEVLKVTLWLAAHYYTVLSMTHWHCCKSSIYLHVLTDLRQKLSV